MTKTWRGGILMNKEEILAESRKEHKNQDIYEKEVIIKGYKYACFAMIALALIFEIIQLSIKDRWDYGLCSVVFTIQATNCWYSFIKLRKRSDLICAICFTVIVLVNSATHIVTLIS